MRPASAKAKDFFGHEAEIRAIDAALGASSFVLLLGPGGAGKTRLARSVFARDRASLFCDFSGATSAGDTVRVLANALDISLGSGNTEAVSQQIRHALAARAGRLVVFDNLETIGDGAALIASCVGTGPRFLATSRAKLGAPEELDVEIGPLETPDAVALFVDRARAVAPEFQPDEATEELVERLHGSPLAIELAAARAHVLSPRALIERFSKHIDLVKSSSHAWPERHRSLRTVVMASWALCDDADRGALAALSVFAGGFDLAAAEAVIGLDAPDRIESLLASSLVHRAPVASSDARFSLYESVREFAAERLGDDADRVRGRHAAHFRALASRIQERAANAEPGAFAIISTEAENLLAAFRADGRRALAFNAVLSRALPADLEIATIVHARDTVASLLAADRAELELALVRAFRREGGATRSLEQAQRAMGAARASEVPELVVDAEYMMTVAQLDAGRVGDAIESAERAIALGERCGAVGTVARVYGHLGFATLEKGDVARASRCAESVLAIAREHGFVLVECFAENLFGAVHGTRGELALAREHLERGLALARRTGSRTQEAIVLGNLAKAVMLAGDADRARELLEAACEVTRLEGTRYVEVPQLTNLALVDADVGRLSDARARALHAERLARELQHVRQVSLNALLLGAIALEEGRFDDARSDFERARAAASSLKSASSEALADAGLAAREALVGSFDAAAELIERAERAVPPGDWSTHAIVDARRVVVLARWAVRAAEDGDERSAAARRSEASARLERVAQRISASVELRVALRLSRSAMAACEPVACPPTTAVTRASMPRSRFDLVTRAGVISAGALPDEADLGFDAIERTAVVDGRLRIDLRKKPIAARLLEVILAEPTSSVAKARLYEQVWRAEFRTLAQGAALYKAVDRLTKMLDADTRRFLRWDEAGSLVLAAKQPALLRPARTPDAGDDAASQ